MLSKNACFFQFSLFPFFSGLRCFRRKFHFSILGTSPRVPRTSRRRRARSRAPLRLVLIFYIVCLTKPIPIQFRPFWVQSQAKTRQEVRYLAYLVAAGTCLGHAWDRLGPFSSSQGYCLSCFCAVSHIMSCPVLSCPFFFFALLCFAVGACLGSDVFLCFAVSDSLLAPRERWGGRVTFVSCEFHVTIT